MKYIFKVNSVINDTINHKEEEFTVDTCNSEEEAEKIADAINRVNNRYGIYWSYAYVAKEEK